MARRVIELMDDMHLSSKDTFLDYYYAMQANNVSQASNILAENPSLSNQIITADNINILLNETYRRELQPKVDIDYFLAGLNAVFEKMISYTRVRGEWNKDTQYDVHNLVYYKDKGYFAYTNEAPPVGTLPTDTKYWLEYDIRGLKGYGGFKNINYLGVWSNSMDYKTGDSVIYKNKLWWAIADNTNTFPNLNHYPWVLIVAPDIANKTPIQKQTPTGYNIGDFWWQITKGDDIIQTTWVTKTPDPIPRFAAASFMIGNNIYVVGGQDRTITATSTNEVYDTVTNTWSQKADYPMKIEGAYGFSINNVGYCAGGMAQNNIPISDAYSYNPTTNTWTSITSLPQPLSTCNTTTTIGNYAYIIGGLLPGGTLIPDCYRFDPSDLSWTKITEMPKNRYCPAVEHVGNKIYAIGGVDVLGNYYSDTQIYDIVTNTWSTGTSMLSARGFCGSFEHKGEIYVVGGSNDYEYSTNVNEVYNTVTNTWRNDIPMQYKRNSLVGQANSTKGYAIGGINIIRVELNGYVEEYQFVIDESTFEMIINTNISNNIITEDNKNIITEDNLNIIRENDVSAVGSKTVSIPMVQGGNYNYYVDWGDGSTSTQITTYNDPQATHTYASDGEYTIKLIGNLDQLKFTGNIAIDLQKVTKCQLGFSSIESMFKNCVNLNYITEDIFNSSISVTSAKDTFNGCQSLSIIPVGLFNNNINITTFEGTFKDTSISIIPNGIFNLAENVTSFKSTFENCNYLTNIPVGLFDNNNSVETFNNVFHGCNNLKSIPNNLFTNNPVVVDYSYAFESCNSLTTLPSNLFGNASANVNNFSHMFANTGLTTLPIGLFKNAVAATNYDYVFNNTKITSIPTNCFNGINASSVNSFDKTKLTNIGNNGLNGLLIGDSYLENCTSLVTVGDNVFNVSFSPAKLFSGCTNLKDIGNIDFTQAKGTNGTFVNCNNLVNLKGFKNSQGNPTISENFGLANSTKLTKQSLLNVSDSLIPQTSSTIKTLLLTKESLALLSDVEKLIIINKYWKLDGYTPNITAKIAADLVLAVKGNSGLTSQMYQETSLYFYVTLLNPNNVSQGRYAVEKSTGYIYNYDKVPQFEYYIKTANTTSSTGKTEEISWIPKGKDNDISGAIIKNKLSELNSAGTVAVINIGETETAVTNTGLLGNQNLDRLCVNFTNLVQFNLKDSAKSTPTSMNDTFSGCTNLTSIDLGSLSTANVTTMANLFYNCAKLTDWTFLNKFNTSKVTNMNGMFDGCKGLTTMPSLNMSQVTTATWMFSNTNITAVKANIIGTKLTNATGMFAWNKSLITLPSDYTTVFGHNSNLTSVVSLFEGDTGLKNVGIHNVFYLDESGFVPQYKIDTKKLNNQLFTYCPNITNMSRIVRNTGVGGDTNNKSIPMGLFYHCPKVINISYAFEDCKSLVCDVDLGVEICNVLFAKNLELKDISYLFHNAKITGYLTENTESSYFLFPSTKIENASHLWDGCSMTATEIAQYGNIPFIYKSKVLKDISYMFANQTAFRALENMFTGTYTWNNISTYCPALTNCSYLFSKDTELTGNGNKLITVLKKISTLTNHAKTFENCTKLSDYGSIASDWK